jgi:acylphosphatase
MVSSGSRASDSTPQRREAYYSGHVQGVGFRDAARRIAQGIPVTGFVRNLDDGRVQLVVEGTRSDLAEFLESISRRMDQFIRQAAVDERPATGEFKDFAIRH